MDTPEARTRRGAGHHLALRFGLLLCLGAAVILMAAGAWNIALQRQHMTQLISTTATGTAETILRSTRDAMLAYEPDRVHAMIDTIGSQQGFDRIRIFDKQGRIQSSTDPADVGTMVDTNAEQCFVCHQADRPLERLDSDDRVRTFRRDGGEQILGVIAPIRNEPDCSSAACHAHPASQQVLGVLDVQLSLGPVEAQLAASEQQLGIGLLSSVLAVLILAGLLTWRMVLRPVQRLTLATERVAAGDLSVRMPIGAHDEIGAMTRSWNTMVDQLDQARDELRRWSHTLEQRVEQKTAELGQAHQRMLLAEKMASLGKLAAIVAHEINNPLAGIATYAKLLRRQRERAKLQTDGKPDDSLQALELIEKEALRCGDIVRNLLSFSRQRGARIATQPLAELLERSALLVKHQAELQDVELRIDVEPDLPPVPCDGNQVQQLLLALCMNALEAMPDGGALGLAASRGVGDREVQLSVSDTGRGIAPELLPRIYEPFFTTKEEGNGVGLGLAVVYGIVERHHGRIEVESRSGQGTIFRIHLPLDPPEAPTPADAAGARAAHRVGDPIDAPQEVTP